MKTSKLTREQQRRRRHARVRAKISGTAERPRICVSRSLIGMSIQLIDDASGKTLTSVNSKKDASGDAGERKGKIAVAYQLGKALAQKAKDVNVTSVVFDRSGLAFHGRVKAAADGARDGGLQF
ncbi:MAG: 50S ribosomal protein L18 [Candidatus Magasanikbacteria bacterium]|jgi:large subunit ribosomal protein L18|nr:50S ribosomal protein L18 [Candidatus Magasanikbacteria bacterium]